MIYRRKPTGVTAMQFDGPNGGDIIRWIQEEGGHGFDIDGGTLYIHTPAGGLRVSIGDWVVQEVTGEFLPIKSNYFSVLYEEEQP